MSYWQIRGLMRLLSWSITLLMLKGDHELRPPHCLELLPDLLYLCSFLFPPHSFSFSPHRPIPLSHAPFFYTPYIPDPISLLTWHQPHSPVLSIILIMYHSLVVSHCFICQPLSLSLCLLISLFSAPPRLAHYFCSVVHSVWGWTRTPPWPPVRGERLSGTKTSIAPFFSSLLIPCDRW